MVDEKYAFVVGCQRSGTTFLRRVLSCASGLFDIKDETGYFRNYYGRYGDLRKPGNRQKLAENFSRTYAFSTSGVDAGEFFKMVITSTELDYGSFFALFARMSAEKLAGFAPSLIVEKTPTHTFYVNRIRETFPRAKIIGIVRNPFAVVSSNLQYGIARLALTRWRRGMVIATTKEWLRHHAVIESMNAQDNAEQFFYLSYEELVANPKRTLPELGDFLGVNLLPALEKIEFRKDTMRKYESVLTPSEMSAISYVLGPSASKWIGDAVMSGARCPSAGEVAIASALFRVESLIADHMDPRVKSILKRLRGDPVIY